MLLLEQLCQATRTEAEDLLRFCDETDRCMSTSRTIRQNAIDIQSGAAASFKAVLIRHRASVTETLKKITKAKLCDPNGFSYLGKLCAPNEQQSTQTDAATSDNSRFKLRVDCHWGPTINQWNQRSTQTAHHRICSVIALVQTLSATLIEPNVQSDFNADSDFTTSRRTLTTTNLLPPQFQLSTSPTTRQQQHLEVVVGNCSSSRKQTAHLPSAFHSNHNVVNVPEMGDIDNALQPPKKYHRTIDGVPSISVPSVNRHLQRTVNSTTHQQTIQKCKKFDSNQTSHVNYPKAAMASTKVTNQQIVYRTSATTDPSLDRPFLGANNIASDSNSNSKQNVSPTASIGAETETTATTERVIGVWRAHNAMRQPTLLVRELEYGMPLEIRFEPDSVCVGDGRTLAAIGGQIRRGCGEDSSVHELGIEGVRYFDSFLQHIVGIDSRRAVVLPGHPVKDKYAGVDDIIQRQPSPLRQALACFAHEVNLQTFKDQEKARCVVNYVAGKLQSRRRNALLTRAKAHFRSN